MANHDSTKKTIRKNKAKASINKSRKSMVKTYVKKLLASIQNGDTEQVKSCFIKAQSELMRGVAKGVLAKNTASRKISRLNLLIKKSLAS